jgi:hypothetical protein
MLSSGIRYVAPYDAASSSSSSTNKVSVEENKTDAVIISADGTRDCVVCRRKVTQHFWKKFQSILFMYELLSPGSSVSNLHSLFADTDPDLAFLVNADQDHIPDLDQNRGLKYANFLQC